MPRPLFNDGTLRVIHCIAEKLFIKLEVICLSILAAVNDAEIIKQELT